MCFGYGCVIWFLRSTVLIYSRSIRASATCVNFDEAVCWAFVQIDQACKGSRSLIAFVGRSKTMTNLQLALFTSAHLYCTPTFFLLVKCTISLYLYHIIASVIIILKLMDYTYFSLKSHYLPISILASVIIFFLPRIFLRKFHTSCSWSFIHPVIF